MQQTLSFIFVCRFIISAPNVFHVGVYEKVFVQMETCNRPVSLYLEDEISNTILSEKGNASCREKTELVKLKVCKLHQKVNNTDISILFI